MAQRECQKHQRESENDVCPVSAWRWAIQDQGLESPGQNSEQLFEDDDCKHCWNQKAIAQDHHPLKTGQDQLTCPPLAEDPHDIGPARHIERNACDGVGAPIGGDQVDETARGAHDSRQDQKPQRPIRTGVTVFRAG